MGLLNELRNGRQKAGLEARIYEHLVPNYEAAEHKRGWRIREKVPGARWYAQPDLLRDFDACKRLAYEIFPKCHWAFHRYQYGVSLTFLADGLGQETPEVKVEIRNASTAMLIALIKAKDAQRKAARRPS